MRYIHTRLSTHIKYKLDQQKYLRANILDTHTALLTDFSPTQRFLSLPACPNLESVPPKHPGTIKKLRSASVPSRKLLAPSTPNSNTLLQKHASEAHPQKQLLKGQAEQGTAPRTQGSKRFLRLSSEKTAHAFFSLHANRCRVQTLRCAGAMCVRTQMQIHARPSRKPGRGRGGEGVAAAGRKMQPDRREAHGSARS